MRCGIITIICVLSFMFSSAQIVQFGVVRELNSKEKPVAGVGISLITSTDFQPVASNSDGTFRLVFSEKKAGDIIYNIRITKEDYEIVNIYDFKNGFTLSSYDTMKIIIASKENIERMRLKYYNIFYNYQEKEYRKSLDTLQKKLNNQLITIEEYRQRVSSIESELQDANNRIDEYANFFARINQDDLDSMSSHALMLLELGNIEDAIRVFDQQDLITELKNKVSIRHQATESINLIIPKLQEEVQYRQLVMGEENIQIIKKILENIALTDTSNFQYLFNYALFLSKQMDTEEAMKWGHKALLHAKTSENKSDVLHMFGHMHYLEHNFDVSERYLIQAIEESENLKEDQYDTYLKTMCYPLNTLANIYIDQQEFAKAEQLLLRNLEIRRLLVEKDSTNIKYYAIGLNNLGELYGEMYKINIDSILFEKGVKCFEEAILIRSYTDKINQIDNKSSLANLYNNLGSLYISAQLFDSANFSFQKSMELLEYLMTINPKKYKDDFISCIVNLGVLNSNLKLFQNAEDYFTKGLFYCDQSTDENPQLFTFLKAKIYQNKGMLYRRMNQNENALNCYLKALDYFSTIENSCSHSLFGIYNNLGVLHFSIQQYDTAIFYMKNAREQLECLVNKSPDTYQFNYAVNTYNIAYYYFIAKDKKNGNIEYKKARKLFHKLEKQYPDKCKTYLKDIEEESSQLKKMKKI